MNTPSALETLLMLSAREVDAAALTLGKAMALRDDAQQRLQMLSQLRADYAQQLQRLMEEGLSFAAYRNFQLFLEKIDEAIAGQTVIAAGAAERAAQSRAHWQEKQREGQTWTLLADRAAREARQREARLERKTSDELAARAAPRHADAETT